MNQCCNTCVFYAPPKENYTCGKCDYPVPEWIIVAGGSFISSPDYHGRNCATFKSRADVMKQAQEPQG